ncbi:hypothetical protein WwAna1076 [Wolbachia endosymbiont of Drosophila ananassae]|nr:hypothetical protein WwAna1076 [Wolbachia endosymbiont of Drosophila ananassae]
MELLASIQKKSYFSLMNHGLAHIQRLDMGGLKRGLEGVAQDPHMPSLQERLKVKVESISSFIFINASSTIGPQLSISIKNVSILGFFSSSADQR